MKKSPYLFIKFTLVLIALFIHLNINSQNLIQENNLQYLGAFKVPLEEVNGSRFGYGGTAPVYNPDNNSLFMVGHNWHQMVAEITIPTPVNSPDLNDLPRASFIQDFAAPSEGLMYSVDDGTILLGGLLLNEDDLIGSAYTYYDGDGNQQLSHFKASPDFSITGEVQGMYGLGNLGAGFVSGYMTAIPTAWQADFGGTALTGNCCIPIISRTSYGPAAFAFNPANLDAQNPLPPNPLVYYTAENPLADWDATSPLFNGTTSITGVLFPENSRSVLFFGRHGTGTFCYGTGAECNDPVNDSQGTHAYPYIYQVWAYDVLDLLEVKNGTKQPWEALPYATWELDLPFASEYKEIGGVAYDANSGHIYVSQLKTEGLDLYPVVHVFEAATPLGIELLSLQANYKDNSVHLNWLDNHNHSSTKFEIQQSVNRLDFYTIGTVEAAKTPRHYTFQDKNLPEYSTTLYYRLKRYQQQSEPQFSDIISLAIPSEKAFSIQLIPNPVESILQINFMNLKNSVVDCQVFDSCGRLVVQKKKKPDFQHHKTLILKE